MESYIFDEIKKELERLANSDYRKKEKVHAGEKQLRLLSRLFSKITDADKNSVEDFCRIVSDVASSKSTIFLLAEKLHEMFDKNER